MQALGVVLLLITSASQAQTLRIGPFDLTVTADIETTYTTNVEGQRESEATKGREDIFFTYGFAAVVDTELFLDSTLSFDVDLDFERHLKRTDLNDEGTLDPLGTYDLQWDTTRGAFGYNLFTTYTRSLETQEGSAVGSRTTTRDDNTILEYGGGFFYDRPTSHTDFTYSESRERHKLAEFQDGDEDSSQWAVAYTRNLQRRIRVNADFSRETSDILEDPEDYTGNDDTLFFGLQTDIWERPSISYEIGYEKESSGGDDGEWEVTHSFSLNDGLDSSFGVLRVSAEYTFEQDEEEDDIGFTYTVSFEQNLGSTITHSLAMEREPVKTFGSSADTDSTTYSYTLEKSRFLFPFLTAVLSVGYTIDNPLEPGLPTEEVFDSDISITQSASLWRDIQESLEYSYSFEDSNLEVEILDEHQVILTLGYTF